MRKSNFELLRIIAMLMIVMGHMGSQGLDISAFPAGQDIAALFLCSGARISVSLFLMLGLWFMVDSEFVPKRVLKLYGALWFWAVLLTYILVVIGQDVSKKDMISCFFPILRRWMWFVPVYIVLMLLSPFLHKACIKMREKELFCIVIIGLFFLSFVSTVSPMMDDWYCALVWFIYMYFFVYYFKHYLFNRLKGCKRYLFIGVAVYAVLVVVKYISAGKEGVYSIASNMIS